MQELHTAASVQQQTVAMMPQPDGSEIGQEHERSPERQYKPQALVVDDSADIAFMLAMIMQHVGYNTLMATSAADALDLARQEHFDVVISDIGMPGMDGYALAEALRALPDCRNVPMIAVTGFEEYDNRDRALAAGFNAHMKKPIDIPSFITLIKTLSC